jgi:spore coat protein X
MSSSKKEKRHHHDCKAHKKEKDHSSPVQEMDKQPNAEVVQSANQYNADIQESDEVILIKDSCNVTVQTTENQAAVSLQLALQLTIALVIKITIGTSDNSNSVTQQLLQHFDSDQQVIQKIHIENSKDITVTTTNNEIAANIQAMLQVLLALVAKLEIL